MLQECQTKKAIAKYLISQDWATIGGRVEEYSNMIQTHGEGHTYWKVVETYKESADEVWRGILVFKEFGSKAYYSKNELLKITQPH